jgi:hypothetical protein
MNVITAPDNKSSFEGVSVFLAGGIQKCPEWQDEVISIMQNDEGTLFNPRRKNFPIHDPNAAIEQITWEHVALGIADIFSIWFCNADSDQPICMYELGRYLALKSPQAVVIGVEPGYRREADVRIQSSLAWSRTSLCAPSIITSSLNDHVENIRLAMKKFTYSKPGTR